jgi:hypothetical protein
MTGTLQDVVVALQAAARQAGVYPAGHPSRAAAFQNAHSKLAGFLTGGGGLTLGVAKDALLAGARSASRCRPRARWRGPCSRSRSRCCGSRRA